MPNKFKIFKNIMRFKNKIIKLLNEHIEQVANNQSNKTTYVGYLSDCMLLRNPQLINQKNNT